MGLLELKPKLKKKKKSPDEERRENPRQRKQELTYRGPESRNTWPVPQNKRLTALPHTQQRAGRNRRG